MISGFSAIQNDWNYCTRMELEIGVKCAKISQKITSSNQSIFCVELEKCLIDLACPEGREFAESLLDEIQPFCEKN
ncbi:unnamed protein product [Caenorhabditis angaria]|uniref:DUF19 domain-containing protein n=1 Tax=Caenorhabditis angaria TaxID=860376 RepID=A0A9P1N7J4_9PELO|nr:unnamed protein product [Caenorhabditis angaria]